MISLCITEYNRYESTLKAFEKVYDVVDEVVIVDDHSDEDIYNKLEKATRYKLKIKLRRNETNLGCYFNKRQAVSLAKNPWVILFDSDNVIHHYYIERLLDWRPWNPSAIYQPSFAKPEFDFRAYEGELINHGNVASFIDRPMISTMLNACNYFVNRDEYLKVFDTSIEPVTSDSEYFALKWLEAGNNIFVVPFLQYEHSVHEDSHYKVNHKRTPEGLHDQIIEKFRNMK